MEEALIRSGANIAFKEPSPEKEISKTEKWIAGLEARSKFIKAQAAKGCRKQRIISGLPLDPVDRKAALVTMQNNQE